MLLLLDLQPKLFGIIFGYTILKRFWYNVADQSNMVNLDTILSIKWNKPYIWIKLI